MKYLILVLFMLPSTLYSISSENLESRVFIRANFVSDLEIDIRGGELDFGDIIPGERSVIKPDKYNPDKVQMDIKGKKGSSVQLIFPEKLPLSNSKGNIVEYNIAMSEMFKENKNISSGTSFIIPKRNNETLTFYIGGEIESYTTTEVGTYTGDLNIRVIYDER